MEREVGISGRLANLQTQETTCTCTQPLCISKGNLSRFPVFVSLQQFLNIFPLRTNKPDTLVKKKKGRIQLKHPQAAHAYMYPRIRLHPAVGIKGQTVNRFGHIHTCMYLLILLACASCMLSFRPHPILRWYWPIIIQRSLMIFVRYLHLKLCSGE